MISCGAMRHDVQYMAYSQRGITTSHGRYEFSSTAKDRVREQNMNKVKAIGVTGNMSGIRVLIDPRLTGHGP